MGVTPRWPLTALLAAAGLMVAAGPAWAASADLQVTRASGPSGDESAKVGQKMTLEISAYNRGPDAASNATLEVIDWPPSFEPRGDPYCAMSSGTPFGTTGCTYAAFPFSSTYGRGTLVSGVSSAAGNFSFTGRVRSDTSDPNTANNVLVGHYTVVPGGRGRRGGEDTTPPGLVLAGKKSAKLGKTVTVTVKCSEACTATATGTLSVPKASKVYRLTKATKKAAAGRKITLRLKLSKKARKAAKRALKRKKRVTARLKVVVKDATGNRKSKTRKIRLKLR